MPPSHLTHFMSWFSAMSTIFVHSVDSRSVTVRDVHAASTISALTATRELECKYHKRFTLNSEDTSSMYEPLQTSIVLFFYGVE